MLNQSVNDEAAFRTASATPALLNTTRILWSDVFVSNWSPGRPGPQCCIEDDLSRDPSSETMKYK